MPVLDTGHLLAFPRDMLDAGYVGWGGEAKGEGGEGASGWDYGGAVREGGRGGVEEEKKWPEHMLHP